MIAFTTLSTFYKKYVYKKPEAEIPNFMYYRLRKLLNKGLRLNKIPTFLYKKLSVAELQNSLRTDHYRPIHLLDKSTYYISELQN